MTNNTESNDAWLNDYKSKYLDANEVSATVEYTTERLPTVTIVVASDDTERFGPGRKISVSFCHFRRYDWCWSFAGPDTGYGSGLGVCNGQGFHLPIGNDVGTILRTTMCASITQMEAEMHNRINKECSLAERPAMVSALQCAVITAGPAWELMLDDAIAQGGNAYFERLPHYRGGCPIVTLPIEVSGFTPEECLTKTKYGVPVTVL